MSSLTPAHWLVLAALDAPRLPGVRHGSVEGVSVLINRAGWAISWNCVGQALRDLRRSGWAESASSAVAGGAGLWTATTAGRAWVAKEMSAALGALEGLDRLMVVPRKRSRKKGAKRRCRG